MKHFDVVVVGAGPTGLVLAGLLARSGAKVLAVERRLDRGDRPKAVVLHAPTLELLDSFGLLDEVVARSVPVARFGFHLDGAAGPTIEMTGTDSTADGYRNLPQPTLEGLLEKYALEAGARIEHGVGYLSHETAGTGVTVRLDDHDEVRCSYLVGSDGPRSAVRQALGIELVGRSLTTSYLLVEGFPKDLLGRDEVGVYIGRTGMVTTMPVPGDQVLMAGPVVAGLSLERGSDVPWEQVAEAIDTLGFGRRLQLDRAVRTSHYSVDLRVAERLVAGRVALAGDAAHLNTPAGGQGLNLGIGDAHALAWRLLAALGADDPGLLAGYDAERRPYAAEVAESTFLAPLVDRLRAGHDGPRLRAELDELALTWSQLYPGREHRNGTRYELGVGARVPTLLRTEAGPLPFLPPSDRADRSTLLLFDDAASDPAFDAGPGLPPVREIRRVPHPRGTRITAPESTRGLLVRPDRRVARVLHRTA